MNIPYVMKKCSECGRWLVASTVNFYKSKPNKYGLQTICKECASNRNRAQNNQVNTDPSITRICTTCGREFPATLEYFNRAKRGKYGVTSECKECKKNKNNTVNTNSNITKVCTTCGREFPATLEYFYKNKAGKYGVTSECKECMAEHRRQRYQKHKDEEIEHSKKWNKDNSDKVAEYNRQWRKDNKDKVTEYQKRQNKKRRQARIDAIIAQKRAEYEAERAPLVAEKTCKCCGRTLPASEFYANKQTKDHLGSYCKECHKKKKQENYYHNLETKGWA